MRRIDKVLVANRGEIALRVMKTCKRLGLATVAVYSDADAGAPHVRFADEAVRLGPAPAAESYLRIDAVVEAAKKTGADAVHPGFGFLAENPDFAEACAKAGLTFIGPSPAAIRAMGLKREAKALVAKHGVPLVPGSDGGDQSVKALKAKALEVGLPALFKPSAGGGGKGMRIVRADKELDDAIESGQREAKNAFGDTTLIVEKYLERPRHIEIQLLGDEHGNVVHLFERECSIQRRHQKVVEETPSTALTPELRAQMGEAAVKVAKAIGYTNAGTVEFLLDADGRFYFSEMNTRLQVEHRVTELVTGLDLVEWQLRVARGEKLGFTQEGLKQTGHAVQVRLYAEDPANGFLPATGTVLDWQVPELGGLLVDSGVETGAEVSPHYDPMLAKVIAFDDSRELATAKLARALDQLVVAGLTTNRGFLARLLRHPDYVAGKLHTGFIDEAFGEQLAEPVDAERDVLAGIAVALAGHEQRRAASDLPQLTTGYRNNRAYDQFVELRAGKEPLRVEYRALGGGAFVVRAGGQEQTVQRVRWSAPVVEWEDGQGVLRRARVVSSGTHFYVHTARGPAVLDDLPRFPIAGDEAVSGGCMAPMPGKVVKVLVADGAAVKQGQPLLVLEAMKMEQRTLAPSDGTVAKVLVREGEQVTAGQVLLVLDAAEAPPPA